MKKPALKLVEVFINNEPNRLCILENKWSGRTVKDFGPAEKADKKHAERVLAEMLSKANNL